MDLTVSNYRIEKFIRFKLKRFRYWSDFIPKTVCRFFDFSLLLVRTPFSTSYLRDVWLDALVLEKKKYDFDHEKWFNWNFKSFFLSPFHLVVRSVVPTHSDRTNWENLNKMKNARTSKWDHFLFLSLSAAAGGV